MKIAHQNNNLLVQPKGSTELFQSEFIDKPPTAPVHLKMTPYKPPQPGSLTELNQLANVPLYFRSPWYIFHKSDEEIVVAPSLQSLLDEFPLALPGYNANWFGIDKSNPSEPLFIWKKPYPFRGTTPFLYKYLSCPILPNLTVPSKQVELLLLDTPPDSIEWEDLIVASGFGLDGNGFKLQAENFDAIVNGSTIEFYPIVPPEDPHHSGLPHGTEV